MHVASERRAVPRCVFDRPRTHPRPVSVRRERPCALAGHFATNMAPSRRAVATRVVPESEVRAVDLSGKVALVTGATSGLGKATAEALARRGASVMLGVRNVTAGERVAGEIRASVGCPPDRVTVGPPLDLDSNASVRAFAATVSSRAPRLDILVNNAGTNFIPEAHTPEGVGRIAQINFLGPAALTRLLEAPLLAAADHSGVASIVHVSSVTHRYASIPSVPDFLSSWTAGSYAATKLANVIFAHECQRRWGARGVRSSAVDPGAVYSNLWDNDAFFGSPPMKAVLSATYAPPRDGAAAIVVASLAPFHAVAHRATLGGKKKSAAHVAADAAAANADAAAAEDDDARLRFYARGLFASTFVTRCAPGDAREATTAAGRAAWFARYGAWGAVTLACSLADWPARRITGGRAAGIVAEVPSSPESYDEDTARELWDAAGEAGGAVG